MGGERRIVLWPHYFEADVPRSKCRRVGLRLAVEKVSVDELAAAAREAGYRVEVDKDARHPAFWYESGGRVLVYTDRSKGEVIRDVAERLKARSRGA